VNLVDISRSFQYPSSNTPRKLTTYKVPQNQSEKPIVKLPVVKVQKRQIFNKLK